jgi:signal transduction histidine kinase
MTRVLVIEDEPQILENTMEILEMEGFEAIGADNGTKGIELARKHYPDLIICDIMMPGIDGYQVLLELRNDTRTVNTPFLFLTARADRASLQRGMELGADDYLTKPLTPDELMTRVRTRLEKHRILVQEYEQRFAQLRSNIVYALPHELRTPLSGILGCAEFLMQHSEDDKRILSVSQIIFRSGRRLQRLIENYLAYAQIEVFASDLQAFHRSLNDKQTAAAEVIQGVALALADHENRAKDLKLEVVDAPLRIEHKNFQKIVEELIDNAFKFSDSGSEVHVKSFVDSGYYVFSVSDRGRGMSPQEISSIGAYVQFGRAVFEQQGIGMGLTLARRLVELHGGNFKIESETDKGTDITVTFPL